MSAVSEDFGPLETGSGGLRRDLMKTWSAFFIRQLRVIAWSGRGRDEIAPTDLAPSEGA